MAPLGNKSKSNKLVVGKERNAGKKKTPFYVTSETRPPLQSYSNVL